MSKQPSPAASERAKRAAKKLEGYFGDRATMPTVDGAAAIIDREYEPLVEACAFVMAELEYSFKRDGRVGTDEAIKRLRSALSQSGGAL